MAGLLERQIERLYRGGVDGLFVNGNCGEGPAQTFEQRKRVAEIALRLVPHGKSVVVHVGGGGIEQACALARHAEQLGASAVSSVAPGVESRVDMALLYFEQLTACTGLPVHVYYYPAGFPGLGKTADLVRICELPGIKGVKLTDYRLYEIDRIAQIVPVMNGHDEMLVAALLMGASGGIGAFYNVVPDIFVKLYEAARRNEWEEAAAIQAQINQLIRVAIEFPVVPAIKQLLRWSGHDCGVCLPSRGELTEEQSSELRNKLDTLDILEMVA